MKCITCCDTGLVTWWSVIYEDERPFGVRRFAPCPDCQTEPEDDDFIEALNDPSFTNEYLEKHGYDADAVGRRMEAIAKRAMAKAPADGAREVARQ